MNNPLPEYKVTIDKMDTTTSKFIEDGYSDNLGLRTKFGGDPNWVQSEEKVQCCECQEDMSFVCQIDSFNHDSKLNPNRVDCLSDEQKFMFGDVGIIYIFFCFDCLETQTVFQCY